MKAPLWSSPGRARARRAPSVQRIAYLMDVHEVYPTEILAVTFTNKAAGELKERVRELIGVKARDLWVSTFHSACLRILRVYGDLIGLQSGFAIYDDSDQLDVLKEIASNVDGLGDANPRVLRALIDRAKSNLWSPSTLAEEGERQFGMMVAGLPIELLVESYRRYQERLKRANAVDLSGAFGAAPSSFSTRTRMCSTRCSSARCLCMWTSTKTPTPRSTGSRTSWRTSTAI